MSLIRVISKIELDEIKKGSFEDGYVFNCPFVSKFEGSKFSDQPSHTFAAFDSKNTMVEYYFENMGIRKGSGFFKVTFDHPNVAPHSGVYAVGNDLLATREFHFKQWTCATIEKIEEY